jgi:CHAD domain-containing protein
LNKTKLQAFIIMQTETRLPAAIPARNVTLGDYAYTALHKHYKKSVKHESEVLDDTDPEDLHQMRVGLRRLRTALEVFESAVELPKSIEIAQIRKFAHVLGAVRDIDVMSSELQTQRENLPFEEQQALDVVLKSLQKQRSHDFKKLKTTLHSKQYRKVKEAFEDWFSLPKYSAIACLPIQDVLPDLLLPLISETLLHPAWLIGVEPGEKQFTHQTLEELSVQQGQILHDLRKQMKRVRYQTELFTQHYDAVFSEQVNEFKQLQEILGEIQDSAVIGEYLHEQLKKKPCPVLSDRLRRKVEDAWETWRSLQAKYLSPEFRTELRQRCLKI